jgi:hypothetical protein
MLAAARLPQLWVIQRGGASLLVIASAVALPLQQLILCARPLLGWRAETFFWGDAVALCLVLLGFVIYQGLSPEGRLARRAEAAELATPRIGHSTAAACADEATCARDCDA